MADWNPWHGCHKISSGCLNCYVYRRDNEFGKDSDLVTRNSTFDLPIRKNKKGEYKLLPEDGLVYTCFTSDFFLEDADPWRAEIWDMIRMRNDLKFFIITKRIHRLKDCLPQDWQAGYDHVTICCTVENQERADFRLPIYLKAPLKHKIIACEPLLEKIDMRPYLDQTIEKVVAGGESGPNARVCDHNWILDIRQQCLQAKVSFYFKQTGANYLKDGRLYRVKRKYQHAQAAKAKLNLYF